MLQQEKIDQAIGVLRELGIDAWMLYARETSEINEPSWALVAPAGVVWPSAIIVTAKGDPFAIVGKYDDAAFRASGLYTDVGEGFPEYQHAFGHQLGRTAHDGSTLLGPRWERYGDTPYGIVEAGQVYTLELGVHTDAGTLAPEEDVIVTETGCELLEEPQTELWLV